MDVLISGAGVAGPCLAWWLLENGHRVTIVERAASPRTGGYIVDFWGQGYDIAERMGILPRLLDAGYRLDELRLVDADGQRQSGVRGKAFLSVTDGRFISLPRGELSLALVDVVKDRARMQFADSIAAIRQDAQGVDVTFEHAPSRRFDLVVGCEGLHSRTRDLAFGPREAFERYLGYQFAAWIMPDYPHRDEDAYLAYGEPGRTAARFTLRDGTSLALFLWRDAEGEPIPHEEAGQRALLRRRFAGMAWEAAEMLAALDGARDLYLDRIAQIRMDRWHKGRVALLGDAAFGPSFLAGQGAALAMIGAYVLAGELRRAETVEAALSAYHARLAGFMKAKQDAALPIGRAFVPETPFGIRFRAAVGRLMNVGWIAKAAFGRTLTDRIDLPDYPTGAG
ncbi:FAD-dependent monooxygenase [Novosphingobium sp. ZN18A2]|uniref:FAD-dependent monooxygenase n=1 Tax=Novosphingobium sp. ZN18A2 TaxID=3079861 RepID=UPI0030CCA515